MEPCSHSYETQVECSWFEDEKRKSDWFYLKQLEVIPAEEAKAQVEREAEQRKADRAVMSQRHHELTLAKIAAQPTKK